MWIILNWAQLDGTGTASAGLPGGEWVKKNSGRRKAPRPRKKDRKGQARQAVARATPAPLRADARRPQQRRQETREPAPARRSVGRGRFRAGLDRIDWPAVAILVVPLVAVALLDTGQYETGRDANPISTPEVQVRVLPEMPSSWHGDLSRETMPIFPEPANHAALAPPEPPPAPWHGDLASEPMPLFPEPLNRTALAPLETAPAPWHGDLALEAMLLFPEPANHMAAAPIIGTATAAAVPEPICLPERSGTLAAHAQSALRPSSLDPAAFGRALAQAARAQTEGFVVYNPRYVSIAYPRGDTPSLYGVCTDVVVRAYRALGIDLQELIHTSRLGRGDPSIDHRRVEIVGRFLTRHGTRLEMSEFAEDYRPGDIVTYHRPQGRVSQHHIAVVSDLIGPSGRPLIIHNRGWGPQIEDALFVDRMTGHYRFTPSHAEAYARSRQPRVADRGRRSTVLSVAARR